MGATIRTSEDRSRSPDRQFDMPDIEGKFFKKVTAYQEFFNVNPSLFQLLK